MLIVILCIVLLQGGISYSALLLNGGFDFLKKFACTALTNNTQARKNTLENLMINKWSNLDDYQERIDKIVDARLKAEGKTLKDLDSDIQLGDEVLYDATKDIIDLLRFSSATEAYLVLEGNRNIDPTERQGLLIRNLEQDSNASSRGFLMEKGAPDISRSYGLPLDSYWTSRFDFGKKDQNMDWYNKPVEAARKYPHTTTSDAGYWSDLFRWHSDDIRVMSYSVPLMKDGRVYGVLGVTVSEDCLESLLPSKDLDADKTGSYILARTKDGSKFDAVYSTGVITKEFTDKTGAFSFEKNPVKGSVYAFADHQGSMGNAQTLNLYGKSSVNSHVNWAVVGILPENTLFKASNRLRATVVVAALLSLLIGAVGAMLGSRFFTKPILRMAEEIKQKDVNEKIELKASDVSEIDALSKAITSLNAKVRENASKVSQIIDLVDLPFGVIEYQLDSKEVFCTKQVVSMLGMKREQYQNSAISKEYFDAYVSKAGISGLLKVSSELNYKVKQFAAQRWIHFKSMVDEDKVLITALDVSKDMREKERIRHERDYDILTCLLNRQSFEREVKNMLESASENDGCLRAMIMWDLDSLKYVNDVYGHEYGDQYIQRAAGVFGNLAKENGIVGRISGDEFMAYLPKCESKEWMLKLLEGVKKHLESSGVIMPDGELMSVRASGGVACYPEDGTTFEELKRHADFAMYGAKNTDKGGFCAFNKDAYEREGTFIRGKEQLDKLIDDKQVDYAFQPVVDVDSAEVFGYEILMRPRIRGLSSPADVMRLAAVQSRLNDIEELTFTQAIREYAKNKEKFGNRHLFINSVPNEILQNELLEDLFKGYQLHPHTIIVEMIAGEQTDEKVMKEKIRLLKELHSEIAIDDFGSGIQSETALEAMKPDYVKIDISVVKGIELDLNRQEQVRKIVSDAGHKHVKVIAEGVERQEEMEILIQLGVNFLQGYYIGRPEKAVRDIHEEVRQRILAVK